MMEETGADIDVAGILAEHERSIEAERRDAEIEHGELRLCEKRFGSETCDRKYGHEARCSWYSDVVLSRVAIQVNEMHSRVTEMYEVFNGLKGMIPGVG